MREQLHTNGKFYDAFRVFYLYDIQLFFSSPKWKKQRKTKEMITLYDVLLRRVINMCVYYLSFGSFFFFSLVCFTFFLFSH